MSRNPQYLNKGDRYNFLIDRIQTTLRLNFNREEYWKFFKKLNFSTRGTFVRQIGENNEKIKIRLSGEFIFVEINIRHFNFNKALFYFYQEKFKEIAIRSKYKFGENVIPHDLRVGLSKKGLTISDIRQQGYELFFDYVEKLKHDMISFIASTVGLRRSPKWIVWTLDVTEIHQDIITQPEVELAHDAAITRRFSEVVDKVVKDCEFTNSGLSARVNSKPLVNQTWASMGDKEPKMFVGYCNSTKSHLKLYLKESGRFGAINRLESTYEGSSIYHNLGRKTIVDEADFIQKINTLAELSFPKQYTLLSEVSNYSKKKKLRLLKTACRNNCGFKYWEPIYLQLRTKGSIHTGGNACSLKGIIPVVRRLANEEKLFVRKGGLRCGVYVVDWNWVLNSHKAKNSSTT